MKKAAVMLYPLFSMHEATGSSPVVSTKKLLEPQQL
jgi:hypothetical protein